MKRLFFAILFFIPLACSGQWVIDLGNPENPTDKSTYCTQYRAVLDVLTTDPTGDTIDWQNNFVQTLVDSGVWAKLDGLWMFAQTTNDGGEAMYNWISPGDNTAVANHDPLWTRLQGFTGDEANDYLDLGWNPNTDGVKYTLNSCSFGYYSRVDRNDSNTDMGVEEGVIRSYCISAAFGAGDMAAWCNSSGTGGGANGNSSGMFMINRTGSNAWAGYRNNVQIFSDTDAAISIPNLNMYALCRNDDGVAFDFCKREISMAFTGGALTEADRRVLTDAFETYMDAINKGVIP